LKAVSISLLTHQPVRNAWEHLVLVMPAADGVPLQPVVQALMLLVVGLLRV
jgi:hypothetical protein